LEIGTANGGTLFLFCQIAELDATIISIDLPGGPFGGGYPEWRVPLYKSFAKERQRVHLIRADSHDPKTLGIVKRILGDRKLDFLFIDGDHTYEGVKRDFEMYSPLVRKGGIIAFHDIVPGPSENVGGVPMFWSEIKRSFTYNEIVKDWRQGGYGIGVIYV
ncbi:MAG: class I SAM-dependent methyltransferase, partial [Desulfurococcaceae archaeon]